MDLVLTEHACWCASKGPMLKHACLGFSPEPQMFMFIAFVVFGLGMTQDGWMCIGAHRGGSVGCSFPGAAAMT